MEQTETKEISRQVDEVVNKIESLTIESQDQYDQATDFIKDIKITTKLIKEHYEPERKRLDEAKKKVTGAIKQYTERLDRAEKAIKKMMADWHAEQQRIAREAQLKAQREAEEKRLAQAAEADDDQALEEAYIPEAPAPKKTEGVSYVEVWDFRIVNEQAIPREFLSIDEAKIRKYVKAMQGDSQIGGVEVFSKQQVRVRT